MSENDDEDKLWPNQFRAAVSALKGRWKERTATRLSKEVLEERAREEKLHQVYRGKLTQDFMESEFWKSCLNPELEARLHIRPAQAGEFESVEEVALDHMLQSGEVNFGLRLLKTLDQWKREGEEARKKLAEDARRREEIEEIRR